MRAYRVLGVAMGTFLGLMAGYLLSEKPDPKTPEGEVAFFLKHLATSENRPLIERGYFSPEWRQHAPSYHIAKATGAAKGMNPLEIDAFPAHEWCAQLRATLLSRGVNPQTKRAVYNLDAKRQDVTPGICFFVFNTSAQQQDGNNALFLLLRRFPNQRWYVISLGWVNKDNEQEIKRNLQTILGIDTPTTTSVPAGAGTFFKKSGLPIKGTTGLRISCRRCREMGSAGIGCLAYSHSS